MCSSSMHPFYTNFLKIQFRCFKVWTDQVEISSDGIINNHTSNESNPDHCTITFIGCNDQQYCCCKSNEINYQDTPESIISKTSHFPSSFASAEPHSLDAREHYELHAAETRIMLDNIRTLLSCGANSKQLTALKLN